MGRGPIHHTLISNGRGGGGGEVPDQEFRKQHVLSQNNLFTCYFDSNIMYVFNLRCRSTYNTKSKLLKLVGRIFPFPCKNVVYVVISKEDSICFMSLTNVRLSKDYTI